MPKPAHILILGAKTSNPERERERERDAEREGIKQAKEEGRGGKKKVMGD